MNHSFEITPRGTISFVNLITDAQSPSCQIGYESFDDWCQVFKELGSQKKISDNLNQTVFCNKGAL